MNTSISLGVNAKISVTLSILLILFASTLLLFNYYQISEAINTLTHTNQNQHAKSGAMFIDNYLKEKILAVNSIAELTSSFSREAPYQETEAHLTTIKKAGEFDLTFIGYEDNGFMIRNNGKNQAASDDYDPRKRVWYIQAKTMNKAGISAAYITASSQEMAVTFFAPFYKDNQLGGVIGADLSLSALQNSTLNLKSSPNHYNFVVDNSNRILIHPNAELHMQTPTEYTAIAQQFKKDPTQKLIYKNNEKAYIATCVALKEVDWLFCSALPADEYDEYLTTQVFKSVLLVGFFIICGVVVLYIFINKMLKPLKPIRQTLEGFFNLLNHKTEHCPSLEISQNDEFGDMARMINQNILNIQKEIRSDERLIHEAKIVTEKVQKGLYHDTIQATTTNIALEELKNSVNNMIQATKAQFNEISTALALYTQDDYQKELILNNIEQGGVFDKLSQDINSLRLTIVRNFENALKDGQQLESQSKTLRDSMQVLSHGTNEQARSLKESATALDELTNAMQNMSKKSTDVAEQAKAIQDTISIIKEIADQTNLLALNAAIEAARSGEQGRGFAVVADEVRKLAKKTQQSLDEINKTTDILVQSTQEMGISVQQQTQGISHINDAIASLDSVTQQNAEVANQTDDIAKAVSHMAEDIAADARKKKI